ncbi:MAG: RluA family pseudouridine synthase [Bacteroidales bacterium]|nr:RluA family pseudouridine synthase [Bacteroidales bacterium]
MEKEFLPDTELQEQELELDEEQGMFEHFRLTVDQGQSPIRIDKYMVSHMEDTSRHRVQMAIKEGYVKLGDKTAKANMIVRPGDLIRFIMPYRRRGLDIIPQDIPLDIVYEDDDLLIVNKPAGMVVHPGHGNFDGTLVNALAFYLGMPEGTDGGDGHMGVLVHRIDKDTSGLLVVAKNEDAQLNLAGQFFKHSIERCYNAIVWGDIKEDQGTVDAPIERDPNDRLRFRVAREEGRGKHAVTHYRVLQRYGFVTFVECRLETGRTHQIRVHMSHIGHPLFNDERYGGAEIRKGTIYAKYRQFIANCFKECPRQALHARTLGFVHPSTGEWIRFEAAIPDDMSRLLEKWDRFTKNDRNYEEC